MIAKPGSAGNLQKNAKKYLDKKMVYDILRAIDHLRIIRIIKEK